MISVTLIIGFAFLIEACFGFGGAWIALPLLTLSMPPKDAVLLILAFQCMKVVLLIPAWRRISWKSLNLLPVGMFLGIAIGNAILDVVSPGLFKWGLAVYLTAFVAMDAFQLKLMKPRTLGSKAGSLGAGFFGGVISGITGMGGPPYVIYLQSMKLDKLAFRASIIFIVSIGNYFRLLLNAREIVRNEVVAAHFWPCLAAFTVGSAIGSHLPKILSEKAFKLFINAMLLGAASMLFYH